MNPACSGVVIIMTTVRDSLCLEAPVTSRAMHVGITLLLFSTVQIFTWNKVINACPLNQDSDNNVVEHCPQKCYFLDFPLCL